MTTLREAAQMALDSLEKWPLDTEENSESVTRAIEALRARLSAPEPKPEPYGYIARRNWKMPVFIEADNVEATGLPYNNADYEPVFKAPPQREWQGLTEGERIDIIDEEITTQSTEHFALAQAIEAKLKEKNNG